MLLPFIASVTAVTLCCFFIKNEEIEFVDDGERIEDKPRLVLYLALFVLAIVIVFNMTIVVYWINTSIYRQNALYSLWSGYFY
jgi:preprotein translocase subunit Sec61beta